MKHLTSSYIQTLGSYPHNEWYSSTAISFSWFLLNLGVVHRAFVHIALVLCVLLSIFLVPFPSIATVQTPIWFWTYWYLLIIWHTVCCLSWHSACMLQFQIHFILCINNHIIISLCMFRVGWLCVYVFFFFCSDKLHSNYSLKWLLSLVTVNVVGML